MVAKSYHLGVNWPTTLCENKYGVHFFTINFECHNRYNKLLLCNSENSDIAWWNKDNSECFFFRFPKEKNNILFLLKKTKTGFQKTKKKQVGCFFWKKTDFSQP